MAVDDIISDVGTDNTLLQYQPAAGVEVMLTALYDGSGGSSNSHIYDGSVFADYNFGINVNQLGCKIGLTNSTYLQIDALGANNAGGFTGIQIK